MGVWHWMETNHKQLSVIGVGLTLITVAATFHQIMETRNALQASTELQIQKEGRDIWTSIDDETKSYIYNHENKKYPPLIEKKAHTRIVQMMNYYASANRQHEKHTIDDEAWKSLDEEFCSFLRNDPVKELWAEANKKQIYADEFLEVGNKCLASGLSAF